jgi:hypothetical protein
MGKGVNKGKGKGSVLDTGFRLHFLERTYQGAPRWLLQRSVAREHTGKVDSKGRLNREGPVRQKILDAHQDRYDGLFLLDTCMNPACKQRDQRYWPYIAWSLQKDLTKRMRLDMMWLARANQGKLQLKCSVCGQKLHVMPCEGVYRKWIYVLKDDGNGKTLTPHLEIRADDASSGVLHANYNKGKKRFVGKGRAYTGGLHLGAAITKHTWHFFLSPVRLGPKALDLLSKAPQRQQQLQQECQKYKPGENGVFLLADQQPWAATVQRKFTLQQIQKQAYEYIPLVDPFAWIALLVDLDYAPILAAQQELLRNANEQAKAFVAATLHSAIGKRLVKKDPPEWEEDKWDVKDDTAPPPGAFASSGNIAKAWMDRYRKTLEYLSEEAEKACCRIIYTLRYGPGHRIVEAACQEHGQTKGFLSHGLMHWNHLLREMLLCKPGEAFLTWLAQNKEAKEHIPVHNVLEGHDLGKGSRLHKEVGGLPLQIYALLNPVVIKHSSQDPAQTVVDQLQKIDVQAATIGVSDVKLAKDTVIEIASELVTKYTEKLPALARTLGEEVCLKRAFAASRWQARLTTLDSLKTFENATGLLLGVFAYTKGASAYETAYDKYSREKAKLEYPFKVADFLAKQSRALIKAQLEGKAVDLVEKVDKEGARIAGRLSTEEYELLLANRSVSAYSKLGTGLKILAGPVALVFGGADLVAESAESAREWRGSDPGAAVGHALMAGAALCTIAVAAAETTALLTGAATASWAGPVGWIAAALMLIGALVLSFCTKNDLEKYAQHCWLGPDCGTGSWDDETGKVWMSGHPWPWLCYEKSGSQKLAPDRWLRQREALLRLISTFSISTGNWGYFVYPGYLGGTSAFEVEVVYRSTLDKGDKETYRAMVWPNGRESIWLGPQPADGSGIHFEPMRHGEPVKWFNVVVRSRRIHKDRQVEVCARLALEGAGRRFGQAHSYLPGSGLWLVNRLLGFWELAQSTDKDKLETR